ncbi:unnamed protein product [Tilletia laevis]|nr:hypothetical protein CF336_g637 [Tilletia laevis]KAE8205747.1 hypothetical protein CF328_g316 [Tilletia controversa]CAD6886097.1 unnamed protein product [Tilletia caries]CAD6904019.1 unnamed protein product [Tilletia caries]CAD6912677.1 unnamed protein product [Tilletia controversa]
MRRLVRTPSEHQAAPLRRQSTSHFLGADLVRRQDAGQVTSDQCRGGALYTAPLQGAVVDSAQMLKIEWNKACLLDQGNIDIYVVTSAGVKPLAAYKGIPSDRGFYQAQLHPYWWGGTASANLTLNIVKSGNEVWDSPNPVGPQWVATYAVPGPGQPVPDYADGSTSKADQIVSYFFAGGGLTPGGKAAAIICPLVVVLCGIGLYLRKHHINRFNKTADWANNMDKRMSRISVDWDRGGDGSKGPMPGTRPASFYPRPSQDPSVMGHRNRASQYKPDEQEMDEIDPEIRDAYGGLAGLGASASSLGHGLGAGGDHSGSRISFAASGAGDRRSRISFAPPRESNDGQSSGVNRHRASASIPRVGQNNWRRSVGGSSAFRDSVADSDVPEVPKLALNLRSSPLAGGSHEPDDLLMSPTQHDGPRALANSDVDLMRPSFDSFGTNASGPSPAAGFMNRQTMDSTLSHGYFSANGAGVGAGVGTGGGGLGRLGMGTPGENENSDAYSVSTGAHLPYTSSSPPPQLPSMPGLGSSASGFGSQVRTGMAPPANTSSPDDAMRAYAAARAAGTVGAGVGAGGAGVGAGVGSGAGTGPGGMRTLFAGGLDDDSAHRASPSMGGSMGGSSLNEDDVVGYNEAAAAGH